MGEHEPGPDTRPPLPDAEWYVLRDQRVEEQTLIHIGNEDEEQTQYNPDPAGTAAIGAARAAYCRELDPGWWVDRDRPGWLFEREGIQFGPELIYPASAFDVPKPEVLPHWDQVLDYCIEPYRNFLGYMQEAGLMPIVSGEWRRAMEQFEPDVFQFFPHELRFRNAVVPDYHILRERMADVVDHSNTPADRRNNSWRVLSGPGLVVWRHAVAGRHWVRQRWSPDVHFVSRPLAELLHPLLPIPEQPTAFQLLPVAVRDSPAGVAPD